MTADPLAALGALPGVADAVEEARDAVDRLRAHEVLRRRKADVAAETALRGARASAALDGVVWTLDEVRAVDRRRRTGAAVVHGALRATAAAAQLTDSFARAPRQVLARLDVLASAGLAPDDDLGRPRADETTDDPLELGSVLAASEVPARLDALASLLTSATEAPAVVVAAVIHGELLTVRPFAHANGVIARATERLVLRGRGLDPDGLAAPEVGHLETRSSYAENARAYATGAPDAVGAWIVHCANAVVFGAREGLAVCEAMSRP